MKKNVSLMKVRDGYYERYKRAHDTLWPDVAEQLSENSISMAIYYNEPFLFVFQTAPSDQAWSKIADTETTRRWNTYMSEMLETNPDGTIKMYALEEAFSWGIYK